MLPLAPLLRALSFASARGACSAGSAEGHCQRNARDTRGLCPFALASLAPQPCAPSQSERGDWALDQSQKPFPFLTSRHRASHRTEDSLRPARIPGRTARGQAGQRAQRSGRLVARHCGRWLGADASSDMKFGFGGYHLFIWLNGCDQRSALIGWSTHRNRPIG